MGLCALYACEEDRSIYNPFFFPFTARSSRSPSTRFKNYVQHANEAYWKTEEENIEANWKSKGKRLEREPERILYTKRFSL